MKIVVDSCTDLDENLKNEIKPEVVPFKINIDGIEYVDDENLDVDEFREKMISSEGVPKTSCPSPYDFEKYFKSDEDVIALTISSKLSGTYNSAMLAKESVESSSNNKIHVVDSKVASAGETLVAIKIREFIDMGQTYTDVIKSVDNFLKDINIYFICGSLTNLIKNGRIPSWKGLLAEFLHIVPIMKAHDGSIELYKKFRGSNRAFKELIKVVKEQAEKKSRTLLSITHVNNEERANMLKTELEKLDIFKRIVVVNACGLSTVYADNEGIVVSF